MKLHYVKEYEALVDKLVFGTRFFQHNLHISSSGSASIGFNFNLQDTFTLHRVLDALGFDVAGKKLCAEALVAERYYIGLLRSSFNQCNGSDLQSLKLVVQNILSARKTDVRYKDFPQFKRTDEFALKNKDKGYAIVYAVTKHYERIVDNWLTAFGFDILKSNSHLLSRNSRERAVLVSLAAQHVIGVEPDGTPLNIQLANAFADDDRSEVWFNIRYCLFDNALPNEVSIKHRYFQSEIFSLYDDAVSPDNISRQQCKKLYAMYNRHKAQILHFERHYNYLIPEANAELGLVGKQQIKTLEQSFSTAYNHVRTIPYTSPPIENFVEQVEEGIEDLINFWAQDDDLDYEIALAS
ncbi:MAG: hypothetical protein P8Y28_00570 [Gammaproteobacteria bacterium]|jgi:hypothetical protein